MAATEPRNPLYFLLLLVGVVFVVTALAYAVVPVLEQKAVEAGNPPPPSDFRDALRRDGWRWLLYEVGALIVAAIASMMLDRYRGLRADGEGRASWKGEALAQSNQAASAGASPSQEAPPGSATDRANSEQ